jgi:hypothetical protein
MKKLFHIAFFLLITASGLTQQNNIPVPPSKQNTFYFSIDKFNRQPELPDFMRNEIAKVIEKPKSKWTQRDSLFYAFQEVHLEEFGLALSIFSRINVDTLTEPISQQLYRTSLFQTGRYEKLLEFNTKTIPNDDKSIFSVKEAILTLNKAYLNNVEGGFDTEKDTIFTILYSDDVARLKKYRSTFKNEMVELAKNIDSALRYFTFLHDGRDRLLSKAFEEFGDFQKSYFYISNAYLCYAIARHYYRNNKELSYKYNRAIDAIYEKNYLLPSFRTIFGKVIDNRYNLKEELVSLRGDTIDPKDHFKPPKIEEKKDYLPWVDFPLIVLSILFLGLLFVLLFVKSK